MRAFQRLGYGAATSFGGLIHGRFGQVGTLCGLQLVAGLKAHLSRRPTRGGLRFARRVSLNAYRQPSSLEPQV